MKEGPREDLTQHHEAQVFAVRSFFFAKVQRRHF